MADHVTGSAELPRDIEPVRHVIPQDTPDALGGMSVSVYRCLLLGNVDNYLDAEGRPLGEIRAHPQVRKAVATSYRPCPYAGSRQASGRQMNLSALRQVGRNWDDVLKLVRCICDGHRSRRIAPDFTLLEFARLTHAGLQLPAYLMFRQPWGLEEAGVPASVGATHKMLAGLFGLAKNLLLSGVAAGEKYDRLPVDPELLAEFAESSGMLVGRTGTEVCAGPPEMIDEVLRLIVSRAVEPALVEEWDPSLSVDASGFFGYAEAVARTHLWMLATALQSHELIRSLRGNTYTAHRATPGR